MPEIPSVPSLWRFLAHPASVPRARQVVAGALPYGLWPHLADNLSLLTSALVTNAIRHGSRHEDDALVELVLWAADGHCWLAVSDPGTGCADGTLKPAHPSAESETGRGLLLVDTLAAAWAVVPRPIRGTSVIAGLPLHRGG